MGDKIENLNISEEEADLSEKQILNSLFQKKKRDNDDEKNPKQSKKQKSLLKLTLIGALISMILSLSFIQNFFSKFTKNFFIQAITNFVLFCVIFYLLSRQI